MREVKISKLSADEIKVLQNEIDLFRQFHEYALNFWSNEEFYTALSNVDVAHRLWVSFRNKLESDSRTFNMRLRVNEAVVLLRTCVWERTNRSDYEKLVTEKVKGAIDQQLKSLNGLQVVTNS